jgi:hypothetical protein
MGHLQQHLLGTGNTLEVGIYSCKYRALEMPLKEAITVTSIGCYICP